MTPVDTRSILDAPFRLESVEEIPDPVGGGGVWFRYVIMQGPNTIVGTRSGSRSEVDGVLDQTIVRLNDRFGKHLAKLKR